MKFRVRVRNAWLITVVVFSIVVLVLDILTVLNWRHS